MALVTGTVGNDFIHVLGDGLVPPGGYVNNTGATNLADIINPLDGNDIVHAGGGDDLINMGAFFGPSDALEGGDGYDTVTLEGDYSFAVFLGADDLVNIEEMRFAAGFRYDLYFHNANVAPGDTLRLDASALGVADTLFINTDDIVDSAIVAIGGAGADYFHGGAGISNEFFGGAGEDYLDSDAAYSRLDGGAGNDQLYVNGDGASHVRGGTGDDLIQVQGTVLLADAGDGNDRITLDNARLVGPIKGGIGNDILNIYGTLVVTGNLILSSSSIERLSINISPSIVGTEAKNIIDLTAVMDDSLSAQMHGFGGDDKLTGTSFSDKVYGDDGNDQLSGGTGGNDTLIGGLGNDVYLNVGGDTIIEHVNGGIDTVLAETSVSIAGFANVERATLQGVANVNATGNEIDNLITGNTANNVLDGRQGNDTVVGGTGADTLIGREGRDQIDPGNDAVVDTVTVAQVLHSTGPNRDLVVGFDANEDRFDLSVIPTDFAAAVNAGTLTSGNFNVDLAAVITAARLPVGQAVLYNPDAGNLGIQAGMVYLIVDANGIAGYQANADYVIQLQNMTGTLTETDFI